MSALLENLVSSFLAKIFFTLPQVFNENFIVKTQRVSFKPQLLHCQLICDPVKLTSPTQHASRWRMRASQTCRLRLLVLLA